MQTAKRKDYLWNIAAGIINAAEAVIMSMIVTRYGQLSDAGILLLAFAIGNVLKTVGVFGGRVFQVSDVKRQYSYRMYLIQRFFSLGLISLLLFAIVFFSEYDIYKIYGIVLIVIIYMVEVMEDCIWGHYQAHNMLYVGAQMFCSRWSAIILVFVVCMIESGDMILSLLLGTISSLIVFGAWNMILYRKYHRNKKVFSFKNIEIVDFTWLQSLTRQTFPLFVAGFCAMFISNIPKFAIDYYLNDEIQAYYGFVAMPVFVVGLLNQFIYQPIVVKLAHVYHNGKISLFKQDVKRQMVIVIGLMCVCVCGAMVFGVPVLSVIYHTDLSNYWMELIILQFAGGFLALSGYFNVILTIMREQKNILKGYMIALFLGIILMSYAVKMAGTLGASVGYLIIMGWLFVFYFILYSRKVNRSETA